MIYRPFAIIFGDRLFQCYGIFPHREQMHVKLSNFKSATLRKILYETPILRITVAPIYNINTPRKLYVRISSGEHHSKVSVTSQSEKISQAEKKFSLCHKIAKSKQPSCTGIDYIPVSIISSFIPFPSFHAICPYKIYVSDIFSGIYRNNIIQALIYEIICTVQDAEALMFEIFVRITRY